MQLEIERRFLIKGNNWKEYITESSFIEQGYLAASSSGWIIRIRSEKGKYKLALKKHIHRISNYEFEYEIPCTEGKVIMSHVAQKIQKKRHYLLYKQQEWIIDCFEDANFPLKIAEIELQKESDFIELPHFISKEISGLKCLSNYQLAEKPINTWDKETKERLLNY